MPCVKLAKTDLEICAERQVAVDEMEHIVAQLLAHLFGELLGCLERAFGLGHRIASICRVYQPGRVSGSLQTSPFATARSPWCESMKMRSASVGGRGVIEWPRAATTSSISRNRLSRAA